MLLVISLPFIVVFGVIIIVGLFIRKKFKKWTAIDYLEKYNSTFEALQSRCGKSFKCNEMIIQRV
ncbi:MAG: hypothetical protein P4L49_03485 [Desulfosporosinus sp.]|nr:hypothetical protein [Desulfosporosinus sp.]